MAVDSGADMGHARGDHQILGYSSLVVIGSGGSSTVFRAVDQRHGRPVAIKVLDIRPSTSGRTAFQREIEAVGRIGHHPNVVPILGSGYTSRDQPYLVLPLFERGTYAELVDENGPMTWAAAVDVGIKLCSAVETVHRAGVVHRDIKPGNVFIGVNPEHPLLADFGISSTVEGARTVTRTVAMTFGYTAPEVLDDERPTPTSDVYSLAMTIYRLIQGLHASHGETPAAVLRNALSDADHPQLSAGVPGSLAEVVADALVKDPVGRTDSALELARQLQQIQRDHGLPVTGLAVADESAVEEPVPMSPSSPPEERSADELRTSMVDALTHRAPSSRQVSTDPLAEAQEAHATGTADRQSVDVAAIIAAAISPEPSDKPTTAADSASAPTDRRSTDLPTVITQRRPRTDPQKPVEPAPQHTRRWPVAVVMLLGLVVVVAVVGIVVTAW